MFKWNVRNRDLIVDEKDVTTVISVINRHRHGYGVEIGNCGWADEPTKWFIAFDARDEKYGHIVDELNKLGTFKLDVSPNFKMVRLYFERGH